MIKQECGIKLHVRNAGKRFRRWEFTPEKPLKQAYAAHQEIQRTTQSHKVEVLRSVTAHYSQFNRYSPLAEIRKRADFP